MLHILIATLFTLLTAPPQGHANPPGIAADYRLQYFLSPTTKVEVLIQHKGQKKEVAAYLSDVRIVSNVSNGNTIQLFSFGVDVGELPQIELPTPDRILGSPKPDFVTFDSDELTRQLTQEGNFILRRGQWEELDPMIEIAIIPESIEINHALVFQAIDPAKSPDFPERHYSMRIMMGDMEQLQAHQLFLSVADVSKSGQFKSNGTVSYAVGSGGAGVLVNSGWLDVAKMGHIWSYQDGHNDLDHILINSVPATAISKIRYVNYPLKMSLQERPFDRSTTLPRALDVNLAERLDRIIPVYAPAIVSHGDGSTSIIPHPGRKLGPCDRALSDLEDLVRRHNTH